MEMAMMNVFLVAYLAAFMPSLLVIAWLAWRAYQHP